jgi:DNA-binding response OmpR family regulator
MRILIVEDDAALASFIRKGLEAEHHAVDVAHEGNQGRSMAIEFGYDLVVLDHQLSAAQGGRWLLAIFDSHGSRGGLSDESRRGIGMSTSSHSFPKSAARP